MYYKWWRYRTFSVKMVVKRLLKPRLGSGCCINATGRTGLAQLLFTALFVSVGLNVFLLFFRNYHMHESQMSTDGRSHVVYDSWAAGVKNNREVALYQQSTAPKLRDRNDAALHPKNMQHVYRILQKSKFSSNQIKSNNPRKGIVPQEIMETNGAGVMGKSTSLCPLDPPGLEGSLRPKTKDMKAAQLSQMFPDMETGGRIRPKDCVPRERLAIIIPFRDRYAHLHILLHNLIPFLRRQLVDATVFVIEQAPPATFNRGALLNIGFLEALKVDHFDCFVLHDVDLVPMNDRNLYRCGNNPRHFAAAMNKHKFRLVYERYFGGVVGMTKEQYLKVNGNSNLYFGWGGEDDDLALRVGNKNYSLDRYDNLTARYLMIRHVRDKGNDKNNERRRLMSSALRRQDTEGLNTTRYKVNSIRRQHLYTWINVSLDMKETLETAPSYTKHDIWKLMRDVRIGKLQ